MATFNYKENVNYNEDRYAPGIYRVHNTEGSPYYIDMGEYVSPSDMERYIENHFEFSQDGNSVTGLDYMGATFENYTRGQMVEMLCATPFNRKLFKGHVSFGEWQEFHRASKLYDVSQYIQRDDTSKSWYLGDSTLFYLGNFKYQHSNFESGDCTQMLQHCSQEDIYNFWLDNIIR